MITCTYDGTKLRTQYDFRLGDFDRPTPELRDGIRIPGVDGVLTQFSPNLDRVPARILIQGPVLTTNVPDLRTFLFSDISYRNLVFSDLAPKYYAARCLRADESLPVNLLPDYSILEAEFEVSPPCLLAAEVIDSISPVNNPGDFRCPAQYTITATGAFTLTVGSVQARWTGGSGTVLIDTNLCRAYLDGVESPSKVQGGFPWLAPGDNAVTVSTGDAFSVAFNPRYA